jgi:hypothetical protein
VPHSFALYAVFTASRIRPKDELQLVYSAVGQQTASLVELQQRLQSRRLTAYFADFISMNINMSTRSDVKTAWTNAPIALEL